MDAALLDLYDTVVRTRWGELSARIASELDVDLAALYRGYELHARRPERRRVREPEGDMIAIVEAAGVEPVTRADRAIARGWSTAFADTGIELWEDSLPVVAELRARGVKTVLVSNCSHATRGIVERLGIAEAFDDDRPVVRGRAPEARSRDLPARAGTAGRRARRAVFVDDQPAYCDGAAALGIETFLIDRTGDGMPDSDGHRVICGAARLAVGPVARGLRRRAPPCVAIDSVRSVTSDSGGTWTSTGSPKFE